MPMEQCLEKVFLFLLSNEGCLEGVSKFKGTYFLNQHQITKLTEHVVITAHQKTPEDENML